MTNFPHPCSANHNDDEYWFTYTPGAEVDQLDLTLSSISTFFTGLFVFDDCPADTPNCIVSDVNLASTADISISFPKPTIRNVADLLSKRDTALSKNRH